MNELDNNKSIKPKPQPLTEENLKRLDQQNTDAGKQQTQKEPEEKKAEQAAEQPTHSEKKQKKKMGQIPQWALTENEAKNQEDLECDDLLNFASNLNFDQYIQDVEVNSMIKAIKSRVEELKNKENWLEKNQRKQKEIE